MTDTQKQPAELPDDVLWEWFKESLKRRGLHDFDFFVLRDVAREAAAYGREQTQWVPVSVRPPARHFRALVTATNDDGEVWVTSAHYNGTGGWLGMRGYLLAATHWMPLPEPPTC